ncbi:MAG: low molecular weight protein arginine phosphatase [Oscillospiraceae bacterium]|nr:low molecular weight protein arginine phosphatase [Oscillospiraceae bacterium]
MTVLFICCGNTCRSPMAEGMFRVLARRAGLEAEAISCGLSAYVGAPAAEGAVSAAARYAADISRHAARPMGAELVADATHILGMTRWHADAARRLFPDCAARVDTLDGADILDPFGGGQAVYEACAGQIYHAVEDLVRRLAQEREREREGA